MLYTAQLDLKYPLAIRYPRGRGIRVDWKQEFIELEIGKGELLSEGTELAVISAGTIAENVKQAIASVSATGKVAHYDAGFIKPLDEAMLHDIFSKFKKIVSVEEGALSGGFGSAILEFAAKNNYSNRIKCLGIPDQFIEQGSMAELYEIVELDVQSIANTIKSLLK